MNEDLTYTSQFRRRRAAREQSEVASDAAYVRWIQDSLNKILGLQLAVDGIAGTQTRSAIRSFQERNGLTVDGIVGPQTDAKLRAALGSRGTGSASVGTASLGSSTPVVPTPAPTLPSPCGAPSRVPCGPTVVDHFATAKAVVESSHQGAYTAAISGLATCIATGLRGFLASGVIRIVGHTSGEGSVESNNALGQARADQVTADLKAALLAQGLSVATFYVTPVDGVVFLRAATAGESSLRITPERTEEDRKKNRRVEIDSAGLFRKPPGPAPAPAEVATLIAQVRKVLGSLPLGKAGIVLPTTARFLDPAEQAAAMTVYGGSLDFTKILITDGLGAYRRMFTVAAQLSTGWHVAMNMGNVVRCWAGHKDLIHELAHAWQSQHHSDPRAFMKNSVACQAKEIALSKATGKPHSAYAYIAGNGFRDYNSEQIATQVEHHFTRKGRPAPSVLSTVRAAAPNAVEQDNVASLTNVTALELGAPGVIPP